MTPEELDEARVSEAIRLWNNNAPEASVVRIAVRLARENWQPPPKVNADTLAARAWLKSNATPNEIISITAGDWDYFPSARAFRAGLAHARASVPNPDDVADLVSAGKGLLDRWDSPAWKDVPNTAKWIDRLRKALAKFEDTRALPDSGET